MIAVSVFASWILVAVVLAVLWVYWRVLSFTFDLIDKRHELLRERDAELASEEARKQPIGERA